MASPSSHQWNIRFAFIPGIAVWLFLAVSGNAAADRPAVSGDYRIAHACFSAEMEVALRNGSRRETAVVCRKIRDMGGFPEWMIEYGRLLLDSCPEKAVLFTGSLADTDSALYWQSVHGYRRDVAVLPMGFLDRLWFTESAAREYGLSLTPGALNNSGRQPLPEFRTASYSKGVLSGFSRILRSNVNSRSMCFSMDLSPDLLRGMLPDMGIRGFVFQYPASPGDCAEARAVTRRLLFNPDGFRNLASGSPRRSDLDSLRRHCRFIASDFLRRSGNSLTPEERNRLIDLIHGPFSPFTVDAWFHASRPAIGNGPQEP